MSQSAPLRLRDVRDCLEGAIPAGIATAAADGIPNVTYLSKVSLVDDDRLALSNQFFSKTARNLAENPRASVLVMDPTTGDQFRLNVAYERTDRRGPVFERLRAELEVVAALQGMQDVFKLRAADIYRVLDIEPVLAAVHYRGDVVVDGRPSHDAVVDPERLGELSARLSRCQDLNTLVDTAPAALDTLFGYDHSLLLLADEDGTRLYTIGSRGYGTEGVGSEVVVGDGIIGTAAARCAPVRVGNVIQMAQLSKIMRHTYQDSGKVGPGRDIPIPGLPGTKSCLAVPAVALGELVGVVSVESTQPVAFGPTDEAILLTAASLIANAVELLRAHERAEDHTTVTAVPTTRPRGHGGARRTHMRFFDVDGSIFIDNDYLIKGVAGRILWALLRQYDHDGRTEFTNREVRLDPTLGLPAFRDNFEGRLILLKRRLDERAAPIRIDKTGRGRFHLVVDAPLRLEAGNIT